MMRRRNIVIIGTGSPTASILARKLREAHSVLLTGRNSTEFPVDLGWDSQDIFFPKGTDVVINLALARPVNDSIGARAQALEYNIAGPGRIFKAANEAAVSHFIQISSIFANWPQTDARWTQYAAEKKVADDILACLACRSSTLWTSLRPAALYGSDELLSSSQPFLAEVLARAAKGGELRLEQGGRHKRNYLNVQDFCEIVSLVIEKGVGGIWDCPGETTTYKEIVSTVALRSGVPLTISESKMAASELNLVPKFNRALYKKIGFKPHRKLRDDLTDAVQKEK